MPGPAEPPAGAISAPHPKLRRQLPTRSIAHCARSSGRLSCLSHVPGLCGRGVRNDSVSVHPVREGALLLLFSPNAIEITAPNNRPTFIHRGPVKLLFFNSGNVSEIGRCNVYTLSVRYSMNLWQREGLRKWNKMALKSQQYMMGALNTYLHVKKKKRSRKYSGEGVVSEKVRFGGNTVTKLLSLTQVI